MRNYNWITFDCYGTLIDWESGISGAFEKIARTAAVPFDRKTVLQLYRKFEAEEELVYRKYREVLNRVARRICVELGYKITSYDFLSDSLPRWRPFSDTNPALERLAQNHKLGILSNIDEDLLAQTCRHFQVTFDRIITAESVASYKPAFGHFQKAKRSIGDATWIHAAQSYFHDIVPCGRLGIDAAWINRAQEKIKSLPPTTVYEGSDLTTFVNWLEIDW